MACFPIRQPVPVQSFAIYTLLTPAQPPGNHRCSAASLSPVFKVHPGFCSRWPVTGSNHVFWVACRDPGYPASLALPFNQPHRLHALPLNFAFASAHTHAQVEFLLSGLFSRTCRALGHPDKTAAMLEEVVELRQVLVAKYRQVDDNLTGERWV